MTETEKGEKQEKEKKINMEKKERHTYVETEINDIGK